MPVRTAKAKVQKARADRFISYGCSFFIYVRNIKNIKTGMIAINMKCIGEKIRINAKASIRSTPIIISIAGKCFA